MIDYSKLAQLAAYYLEDSWVETITATPTRVVIGVDLVLTPEHPGTVHRRSMSSTAITPDS
jgi:hypothetical protein